MNNDNLYINGAYIGFEVDGEVYLQRCPKCHKENYAPSVASGQCAWCGHHQELTEQVERNKP